MLAMLTGGVIWAWLRWPKYRVWLVGGLMMVVMSVVVLKLNDRGSFGNRIDLYTGALAGIAAAPVAGHGLNTFGLVVRSGSSARHIHNEYLTVAWDTGLIGLALAGWAIYRFVQGHKVARWAWPWLGAFLAHALISAPLETFVVAIVLMAILGGSPYAEQKAGCLQPLPNLAGVNRLL